LKKVKYKWNEIITYRAPIGFLARMNAHVNEEFVASVERTVSTRTSGPEAGKVLGSTLIDVTAFDVLDELFLRLVRSFAIDPAAMKHSDFVTNIFIVFFFIGGQLTGPIFRVRVATVVVVVVVVMNGRKLESLMVLRRRRHERRLRHTVTITAGADAGSAGRVDDPIASAVASTPESCRIEST
jgi:hypothetical protein